MPIQSTHPPISAFIIAKNEADRIEKTIQSIKNVADELIVIDSGSEDNTVELSQQLGAKTFYKAWEGFGPQKCYGESLCSHDWILNLDADEILSEELSQEIIELFSQEKQDEFNAYSMKVEMLFFEEEPPPFPYYNTCTRLYNKRYAGFKNSPIHDSVEIKENAQNKKIKRLKHSVAHRSLKSITHWVEKINHYTSLQAENFLLKGKKPSRIKLLMSPFIGFLKAYFIRRYFFYGFNGFVYSGIYAFFQFLRLSKGREAFKTNVNHANSKKT